MKVASLFLMASVVWAQDEVKAPPLAFDSKDSAVVLTDIQNDFLSPDGVTWGVVGESVTENDTVNNIQRLFQAARDEGFLVFVSPHYYYPHDHDWDFGLNNTRSFDVTVISDATAAAKTPELGDGYAAAIANFKFMANAVVNTTQVIEATGMNPTSDTVEGVNDNSTSTNGDHDKDDMEEETMTSAGLLPIVYSGIVAMAAISMLM